METSEEKKAYNKEYYLKNKNKLNENSKNYHSENKTTISEEKKNYYSSNKETILLIKKQYYQNNIDRIKEVKKEYRKNNKIKIAKQKKLYQQRLLSTDIGKLAHSIRGHIRRSLLNAGYTKKAKTEDIIGCTINEFKNHLESKFEDWMTWENKGLYNGELSYGWDLDHIIPLSSGKTEEEILNLNHHTNLQPLCSKINRDIKKNNPSYY
jgi:hypothetical protein